MTRGSALGIAALIVALDRVTKLAIERTMSVWDSHAVIPGIFNIVHTRNRGAAFGLLHEAPEWVRSTLLAGVALAIVAGIVWMIWKDSGDRVPLSLILGGAIGNLYDRIASGAVTDFLQVFIGSYEWPSFNAADSAITIGAIWIGLGMLRNQRYVPQAH